METCCISLILVTVIWIHTNENIWTAKQIGVEFSPSLTIDQVSYICLNPTWPWDYSSWTQCGWCFSSRSNISRIILFFNSILNETKDETWVHIKTLSFMSDLCDKTLPGPEHNFKISVRTRSKPLGIHPLVPPPCTLKMYQSLTGRLCTDWCNVALTGASSLCWLQISPLNEQVDFVGDL